MHTQAPTAQRLLALGSRHWGSSSWWDTRSLLRIKIYDFAVYADPAKAVSTRGKGLGKTAGAYTFLHPCTLWVFSAHTHACIQTVSVGGISILHQTAMHPDGVWSTSQRPCRTKAT